VAGEIQTGKKLHIQKDMKGVVMKRLTEKYHGHYCSNKNGGFYDLYKKLGQLEDAEELCKKVTKHPYYLKDPDGTISETDDTDCAALYSFEKNAIVLLYYGECSFILKINEYGKTWALTKEELQ